MKARMVALSICVALGLSWSNAQVTGISGSGSSGLTLQGQAALAGDLGGSLSLGSSGVLTLNGLTLRPSADDQDDPAYGMYKEGYKCILNEQWDAARKQFELLVKKYPSSKYVADAKYWNAYSLKYSDKKKAVAAYKAFLEAYPKSNYYDDAVSDLGRLENREATVYGVARTYTLAPPAAAVAPVLEVARLAEDYSRAAIAPPAYAVLAQSLEQEAEEKANPEIRMKVEAFMALVRSSRDEKTFDMVKEVLLDPKQPIQLREAALMGLRQWDIQGKSRIERTPSAGLPQPVKEAAEEEMQRVGKKDIAAIYLQILKTDSSKKLSRTVLYQLGYYTERGDERAITTLKQTALDHKQDRELREAALMGLRGAKRPELMSVFAEIARKDPDMRLRQFAIYQIAQSEGSEEDAAFKLLSEYALNKNESRELREAALSSLRSLKGSKAASLYLDVAKNDPDERMQQMALFMYVDASKADPEKTFGTLKEIILDRNRSWSARESAMGLLARLDNDESLGLLVSVAKTEPEERIRMSAINYISHVGKNKAKSLQTLISLFETQPKDQSGSVQSLLFAIASVGNDEAVDFLGKVAKTHENIEVRRSAIQYLGNVGGDKARNILVEILKGK